MKLDPNNESHWITHDEYMKREEIIRAGAPRPDGSSPYWNDWAANNPTPQAKALAAFDPSDTLMASLKGIITGARPIER
jgi:hypothetical protein